MAKAMGIPGYGLMPDHYAHRLELRDAQARMEINRPSPENFSILSKLSGLPVGE